MTSQAFPNITRDKNLVFIGIFVCALALIVVVGARLGVLLLVGPFLGLSYFFLVKGISVQRLSTYVIVAYMPFSKTLPKSLDFLPSGVNVTNLLLGLAMFLWLWNARKGKEKFMESSPLNLPILIFLAMALFSIFSNVLYGMEYISSSLMEFKRRITPFILYFIIFNTVKEREGVKNLIVIMMAVITMVGLMAIYEYETDGRRVGSIAVNPNMLASFFNTYMFVLLGFFLTHMRNLRYSGFLLAFLICLRGMMVALSRGGYLCFAVALHAIAFFKNKIWFVILLLLSAGVWFNPHFLPEGVRYRLGDTLKEQARPNQSWEEPLDRSSQERIEIWKGAWRLIQAHPIRGVGFARFQNKVTHFWTGSRRFDPHNTFLFIAAEMGIPALLVFIWLLAAVFWNIRLLYRQTEDPFAKALALGLLGGFFGLVMSSLYVSRTDSQEIASYFWIFAALVLRFRILDRAEAGVTHE